MSIYTDMAMLGYGSTDYADFTRWCRANDLDLYEVADNLANHLADYENR